MVCWLRASAPFAAEKSKSDYARAVRSAVRGLWRGEFSLFGFIDNMNSIIRLHYTQAWTEGAREAGIEPNELTPMEQTVREDLINAELLFVPAFGEDIIANDRQSGGKLEPLLARTERWANRWEMVRSKANLLAAKDQKKKWVFGDTEHCVDCENLNGRVYRASIWDKYGLRPQIPELNCFGVYCQCRFEDTDEPVTPGRPPNLVGPGNKIIHFVKHLLGSEHRHAI